jgi:hypothetical protein
MTYLNVTFEEQLGEFNLKFSTVVWYLDFQQDRIHVNNA